MIAFKFYVPIITMATPFAIGLVQWRQMSEPLKIMIFLLGFGALAEAAQLYSAVKIRSNMEVRYVYNLIEFSIYGLYFDRLIKYRIRNILFIGVSALSLIGFIVNVKCFQPFHGNNSNFMLFEGLFTNGLCLWALGKMFMDNEEINIIRNGDFWICIITLFFWCSTYFSWAATEIISVENLSSDWLITEIIYDMNMITYIAICFVFLFIRKSPNTCD